VSVCATRGDATVEASGPMDNERVLLIQRKMAGARLRALRTRFSCTLEECAEAVGLTVEGLRERELGRKPLRMSEFWRLCGYFGVTPDEAYRLEDGPSGRLPGARLMRLYRKLLGAALGDGREERGWTVGQAARECSISEERLKQAEIGMEELTMAEVQVVAGQYGLNVADLLALMSGPADVQLAKPKEEEEGLGELAPDVAEFVRGPDAERYLRAAVALAQLDDDAAELLMEAMMLLRREA